MYRTPNFQILLSIIIFALASPVFGMVQAPETDVTRCWSYSLAGLLPTAVATNGKEIYVGSAGARVDALTLDGSKVWGAEFGGEISSNMLPTDAGLLFATTSVPDDSDKAAAATLRSVSRETGITGWTIKLASSGEYYLRGFRELVIVVSNGGHIQAIDPKTGAAVWKREINEALTAPPVFDTSSAVLATVANRIVTLSLASGNIESTLAVPYRTTAVITVPGGGLMAGDERGNVSAFTRGTAKPEWRFKSGGQISKLFAASDGIIAGSHDNFVYYLSSGNGSVEWKRRVPGRISHLIDVNDQFIVASVFDDDGALLVDLRNGKVAGRMAFSDGESLVFDPVAADSRLILALTTSGLYSYSLSGCTAKK